MIVNLSLFQVVEGIEYAFPGALERFRAVFFGAAFLAILSPHLSFIIRIRQSRNTEPFGV